MLSLLVVLPEQAAQAGYYRSVPIVNNPIPKVESAANADVAGPNQNVSDDPQKVRMTRQQIWEWVRNSETDNPVPATVRVSASTASSLTGATSASGLNSSYANASVDMACGFANNYDTTWGYGTSREGQVWSTYNVPKGTLTKSIGVQGPQIVLYGEVSVDPVASAVTGPGPYSATNMFARAVTGIVSTTMTEFAMQP